MGTANFSYSTLADDVLAELYVGGDEGAFSELALRYLSTIGFIARRYSAQGYEHDDLVQEGLLGLLFAAKTFSLNGGMSFRNYASTIVERRFISIIRKQNARKAVPDSALVNLEDCGDIDSMLMDYERSPEEKLMLKEQLELLRQRLSKVLTKRELEVLLLYSEGLSYRKIADELGINEKSVDNALSRARKKLGSLETSRG